MKYINEATRIKGGDVDAANHLQEWLVNHGAFENVHYRDVWLPVVPGDHHLYHESVYTRLRDDVMVSSSMPCHLRLICSDLGPLQTGARSAKPLLLGTGILDEATFDLLEANVEREINESSTVFYTRLQCIYATKRHGVHLPPLSEAESTLF